MPRAIQMHQTGGPEVLNWTAVDANRGPELSRALRGLRFWISMKTQGATKFGQMVDMNMAQSRALEGLVKDSPNLELLISGPSPIVNFRYEARGDYRRKP
jgi:glutamate/tyrosine decarboxylase-like PLP-dependent enzyme